MLQNVLQAINNYFVNDYCDLTSISSNKLVVKEPSIFVKGQYVLVLHTKLNDGVYLIDEIENNELTISSEDELLPETSKDMVICGLAIPRAILQITDEITAYNEKHDVGVKSESLGDYSVTYGSDDVSWITAFRKKLAPYKKTYLQLPLKYDSNWKWWK